jgi:hypothetical protein
MSCTIISSFSDTIQRNWKASDLQQTPTWSKLSPLAADTWHYETNALMAMVATLSSVVCHPLHMCHVCVEFGMKWLDWAFLASFLIFFIAFFAFNKTSFVTRSSLTSCLLSRSYDALRCQFRKLFTFTINNTQRINLFWKKNRLLFFTEFALWFFSSFFMSNSRRLGFILHD